MKKSLLKCGALCFATVLTLAGCSTSKQEEAASSGKEVLEFYHGFHHSEEEWAPAKVMRDLYEKFAEEHNTENIEFKQIPVTGSLTDIMNNKVASGEFPDIIDLAGNGVSLAAIEQGLVVDLKPYIDENGLEKNVGINYVQNNVGGKIYSVHDQLVTLGLWYNSEIFEKAGAKTPEQWETWQDFSEALALVRKQEGVYGFGAGEPAIRMFNTVLGTTEKGRELLTAPLTKEGIESKEFAEALKIVMTEVQANGSANAGGGADVYTADFQENKSGIFFNGVWAAGAMVDNPALQPGLYPGGVAISSPGGGITISSKMSEEKQKIALEFLKYMVSDEVQTTIFEKVGANPTSQNIDTAKLAEGSEDATVQLLGRAAAQANSAKYTVPTIITAWGGDVRGALINAFTESAAEGVNIEQKVKDTQAILIALIG
ncbi:ABC transporter substrate-binding protein [Streptococcus suis]